MRAAPGQKASSLRPELVGERDARLHEVLASAGQRPQRLRLVAVGLEHAQAVHVGAAELGEHVAVEPVRLAAGDAVAVAGGGELVWVHGDDCQTSFEQPVDDQSVGALERDPADAEGHQSPAERVDPGLVVDDASLLELPAFTVDDAEAVLLTGQVDACRLLHSVSLLESGCWRPDREVPWRVLMDRPSVGRRPVAALGASHRREALVSRGPSAGQATKALSRRWSATTRRYEPRRSTPAITARGRTLSFQRTRTTKGKVDP